MLVKAFFINCKLPGPEAMDREQSLSHCRRFSEKGVNFTPEAV